MDDPVSVPLGFWLRTVDSLLDSSMDELFAAAGLTRRVWQVLNTIQRNEPASVDDIDQAMAMFLDAEVTSAVLLDDLVARGWAQPSPAEGAAATAWRLTDPGRAALTALTAEVARHREVMFAGVADGEYRTTVQTLAKITRNLDPAGTRTGTFR